MKITIDETKEGQITINDFVNENEKKQMHEFIRAFNILRIKYKKED